LKMLWEAWRMDENEAEEVQREVEQELARRGSIASVHSRRDVEAAAANRQAEQYANDNPTPTNNSATVNTNSNNTDNAPNDAVQLENRGTDNSAFEGQERETEDSPVTGSNEVNTETSATADTPEANTETSARADTHEVNTNAAVIDTTSIENPSTSIGNSSTASIATTAITATPVPAITTDETASNTSANPRRKNQVSFLDGVIDRSCKENSWFGKKCLKVFKLFINTFSMTFIAEWGDRSQLATIVLVGINDVGGVIVGGCIGHFICTGGAVLAGALIAKYVSVRKVTFIGALVFLGFAIASIFISPQEDGIEGIPQINGYDNATRLIHHNTSLTLALEHIKEEGVTFDNPDYY